MDCRAVQHNLIAFREDNLQPGIKSNIEAHLQDCESCKKLLTGFQSVDTMIEKARAVNPNPYITTRIIQHIENELASPAKKRSFVLRPVLLTLTVIGAIVLGFAIGKSGSDRINRSDENISQIENLKTELYIHDFIDENNNLLINE